MQISLFDSANDPRVSEVQEDEWPGLVAAFQAPSPSTTPKNELPLWSPAIFRTGHRRKTNVEQVSLLVLDVDESPVPDEGDLRSALEGLRAVAHSSSSAGPTTPRWRVAIALSRPVTGEEYEHIWRVFTASLPFPVGQQAKDPSRAWYMPRSAEDGYYVCFEIEGAPLDVEGYLRTQIPKVPEIPKGPEIGNSIEIVEGSKKEREARLAAAATLLGRAWPRTGYRHSAQLALAGALYHQQWGKEEALEFLCEVCREAGDEDRAKRAATIEHTWARGERGESVAGWTSLEAHIPGSVVKTARELVKRNDIEELRSALKRVPGPGNLGNSGTSQTAAGLPKEIVPGVASAVSALDFLFGAWESEPPPTEFLVEGLIPRECVAMWYGRADSLKTWLLFSMAAALAEGKPWLGRYSTKKCKAGIIDYETGRNNIKKRLFMLRAPKELGAVSFSKLKPNQAEFWTELAKHHFDIVFIDSLRRANQGADENNSGEAIVPLELAAEFADATGCAVVFIHHARKETNDGWPEFRGSAAIEDQVDCAYVVRKTETEGGKKTVEVKCVKPGDMTMPEPFAVSVDFDDVARTVSLGASDKARNFEGKKMSDEEVDAAIELSLMSGPKLRVKDIKENIKVRNERVVDRVDVLKRSGRIRFIEEVGYVLESPEARRARVLACVEERGREWRSEADLARGAYVPTSFVREMLRSGDICKAASGGDVAGFIRVEK